MEDIKEFIAFFMLLGIIWIVLRHDELLLWLEAHKIQIFSGVIIVVGIFIIVFWIQHKKDKAIMQKELQLKRINDSKRLSWREEDIEQALNVNINNIDSWHRQRLSTKEKGDRFENRMAAHFRLENYKVQEIGGSGDGGVDLIITSEVGRKIIVQCKCYDYKQKVGPGDVSRTLSAIQLKKADEGWLITSSTLTRQAKDEARQLGILFWERNKLIIELDRKRNECLTYIHNKAI